MVLGIHHIAISVPSMEKALEFYCDVMGFKKVQHGPLHPEPYLERGTNLKGVHADGWLLEAQNGFYLELWEFFAPTPQEQPLDAPTNRHGIVHFCIVVDDLRAEYERLKDKMIFWCEPMQHSVEGEDNDAWVMWAKDPFGNIIDFWQLGKKDPPMVGRSIAQQNSAAN